MKVQIKHRFTNEVIFECELDDDDDDDDDVEQPFRVALERAVKEKKDLCGVDMTNMDLAGACMAGAIKEKKDLCGVDMTNMDLAGACMAGASLSNE